MMQIRGHGKEANIFNLVEQGNWYEIVSLDLVKKNKFWLV